MVQSFEIEDKKALANEGLSPTRSQNTNLIECNSSTDNEDIQVLDKNQINTLSNIDKKFSLFYNGNSFGNKTSFNENFSDKAFIEDDFKPNKKLINGNNKYNVADFVKKDNESNKLENM